MLSRCSVKAISTVLENIAHAISARQREASWRGGRMQNMFVRDFFLNLRAMSSACRRLELPMQDNSVFSYTRFHPHLNSPYLRRCFFSSFLHLYYLSHVITQLYSLYTSVFHKSWKFLGNVVQKALQVRYAGVLLFSPAVLRSYSSSSWSAGNLITHRVRYQRSRSVAITRYNAWKYPVNGLKRRPEPIYHRYIFSEVKDN